jgi:ubiquinone/menaquinone biosynthesis C-methylase UbiE
MNDQSKDHFSAVAKAYSKYRPHYPSDLFQYLAQIAPFHERAWDCGTGNGQAAVPLAEFFEEVIASDISQSQIDNAQKHPRVKYLVGSASTIQIPDQSVDLVVAAHAAHWLDIEEFYGETQRVLKPRGVIGIWCYGLLSVGEGIDDVVEKLHTEILGPYFPQRTLEDHTYTNIPFPFDEFPRRSFKMEAEWTLNQLTSYFETWTGVQVYQEKNSINPLSLVEKDFLRVWGNPEEPRKISWPIHFRHGIPLSTNDIQAKENLVQSVPQ